MKTKGLKHSKPRHDPMLVFNMSVFNSEGSGMHFRLASAARECLVMKRTTFAKPLRSIRFVSKPGIERHDHSSHLLDLARTPVTGEGPYRTAVPLRTEHVVSFPDVCCAERSTCGL